TASGAGNLISGNGTDGVLITGGSNQVLGNFIGTNAAGIAAVANLGNGINVQGSGNTIGGTGSGAGNLISGNSGDGLLIATSGNLALGNFIGTTAGGFHSLGNRANGIEVAGNNNMIGGTAAGARNVISGNAKIGVLISGGGGGNANQVLGNYIGTNAEGNAPVGNGGNGILITGIRNTVGGTVSGARNLISANGSDGALIKGDNGNQVLGNYIGTGADGIVRLGNSGYGVKIYSRGGGAVRGNLISNNSSGGVLVGIISNGITIRQNSIYANGPTNAGPGITLDNGANNRVVAPSLRSATVNGTTLNVKGAVGVLANVSYVLEFYANPTGDPEGKVFLGSLTVTATTTGTQNFTF